MNITLTDINNAKTDQGGFTKKQVLLAQVITGSDKGWKSKLASMDVNSDQWSKFVHLGSGKKAAKKKTKAKKRKRYKISSNASKSFYSSDEWRKLRVRVLEKHACKCMMCGRSPKNHGIVIHVDHIKPRSRYPELSLDISNLQLLCEDCNLGKMNRYTTDWRPDYAAQLDAELLGDLPVTMQ